MNDFSLAIDFRRTLLWFGHEAVRWNAAAGNTIEPRFLKAALKQFTSEAQEFLGGVGDADMVEVLDGVVDTMFTHAWLRRFDAADKPLQVLAQGIHDSIVEYGLARFGNTTLVEAMRRVNKSNYSKFWVRPVAPGADYDKEARLLDGKSARDEARMMSMELGVPIHTRVKLSTDPESSANVFVLAFVDEAGKVRKPSTFEPVDLTDLAAEGALGAPVPDGD